MSASHKATGSSVVGYRCVPPNGQCWWTCTSTALETFKEQLRQEMAAALRSVTDGLTLYTLGITCMPLPPELVKQRVADFLRPDGDFSKFKNGGVLEMKLLSFARKGEIRFVCIAAMDEKPHEIYFQPANMSTAEALARIKFDIILHHCSSVGFQHSSKRQHWDLLVDRREKVERLCWLVDPTETAAARAMRHQEMSILGEKQLILYARAEQEKLQADVAFWVESKMPVPGELLEKLAELKAASAAVASPSLHQSHAQGSSLMRPMAMASPPSARDPSKHPKLSLDAPDSLSAFVGRSTLQVERRTVDGSVCVDVPCIGKLSRLNWTSTDWKLSGGGHVVSNDLATWEQRDWHRNAILPFVLMPDTSEDLSWAKADPEILSHPRLLRMSLNKANTMMGRVKPAHAILATPIHSLAPVHFFVQFVGNSAHAAWAVNQEAGARAEFLTQFDHFIAEMCKEFDDDELLQELKLSGDEPGHILWMRCERTLSSGVVEMQHHRSSVAFQLEDLDALMQRFRMFLEKQTLERARRGKEPMLLCRLAEELCFHPVSNEQLPVECMQHFINFHAYQPGHLLCLPGHHAPGPCARLLPWPNAKRQPLRAVTIRDMLLAQPHVSVPSCVPPRAQTISHEGGRDGMYDDCMDDEGNYIHEQEEDEVEARADSEQISEWTAPLVIKLEFLRASGLPTSSMTVPQLPDYPRAWMSVLPLSQRTNTCVRHILLHHLSNTFKEFTLRLCERSDGAACLRGFVELASPEGAPVCPCCNSPARPNHVEWDRVHKVTPLAVAFTLSRKRLGLTCPAKQRKRLNLTREQVSLLGEFFAFTTDDRSPPYTIGDLDPSRVVAPLGLSLTRVNVEKEDAYDTDSLEADGNSIPDAGNNAAGVKAVEGDAEAVDSDVTADGADDKEGVEHRDGSKKQRQNKTRTSQIRSGASAKRRSDKKAALRRKDSEEAEEPSADATQQAEQLRSKVSAKKKSAMKATVRVAAVSSDDGDVEMLDAENAPGKKHSYDFLPQTKEEKHAAAKHAAVMRVFREEKDPAIRALLQQGYRENHGWGIEHNVPEDFRQRGRPLECPTTMLGPWTPKKVSFEEEMEQEVDVRCEKDSSLDAQLRAELRRDLRHISHRFGPSNFKVLNRPRLCESAEQRDELVNLMLLMRFVLIKAQQGSGKSWLLDEAIEAFVVKNPGARILWISCKRMYGMTTYLRLKLMAKRLANRGITFHFQNYMDEKWSSRNDLKSKTSKRKRRAAEDADANAPHKRTRGERGEPIAMPQDAATCTAVDDSETSSSKLGDQQAVVCSLESIERLKETTNASPPRRYDLVILDEIEELRSNLHGTKTMGDKRLRIFQQLKLILQQASCIWAADADLDVSSENVGAIRFLETMLHRSDDTIPQFFLIWNRYASIKRHYIFHPSGDVGESSCLAALVRSLYSRRRVVVVTNSLQKAKFIAYHCRHHPLLETLFASGEMSISVLTGETSQEDKWRFMKDKRLWRVDLLIYSPVISSGVDYSVPKWTRPWFHEAFMFAVDVSSTARQLFQQLNRVRQLILNRVHVHLDLNPAQWAYLPDTFETVLADTVAKLRRCKDFKLEGHTLQVGADDIDPLTREPVLNTTPGSYNIIYIINQLEANRSQRHFERLLKMAILSSGGSIYQLQYGVSTEEQQRMESDQEQLKLQECERLVNAADWTREQVEREDRLNARGFRTSPGFQLASAKFHLKEAYGCNELTAEFVQRFRPEAVIHKFRRLREQARDGSAALHAAQMDRVRSGADAPEHCLSVGLCNLDTQTMLCAAGLVAVVGGSSRDAGHSAPASSDSAVVSIAEAVGDLFHAEAVAEADIVKRLTPRTPSHAYWWPRLLQVQGFARAIQRRIAKNRDSFNRAKNKSVAAGATVNDLSANPQLAKWEASTHPEDWSGSMKSAVLLDALRTLLRCKYGLRVSIVRGVAGARCFQLDHSFWQPVQAQLQPSSSRFRQSKRVRASALLPLQAHVI